MSGIYIKGMEMPKRDATFLVHVNGDTIDLTPPRKYAEEYHREREIYKLIPVPPHGRLIDADACAEYFEDQARDKWNESTGTTWGEAYLALAAYIEEDAPTIIPASEEGE